MRFPNAFIVCVTLIFLACTFFIPFSSRAVAPPVPLFIFGGKILWTFACLIEIPIPPPDGSLVPALWIAVGPPKPSAIFVALPPIPELNAIQASGVFLPRVNVLGSALIPTVGECVTVVPFPPWIIIATLPGLISNQIGTSVIPVPTP